MREILFRGKRTDNNNWVEGAFCLKDCDDPFGDMADRPSIIKYDPPCDGFWFCVDPETVGQFTGLFDKNGKKIFEGDICCVSRPCVIAYGHIEFKNGCFWFVDHGPCGMLRLCDIKINGFTIEVVGNIHDNPELL